MKQRPEIAVPHPLDLLGLAFLPREEALAIAEASGRAFAAEQEARRIRKTTGGNNETDA